MKQGETMGWETSHANPAVCARFADTNTIYLIQAGIEKKQTEKTTCLIGGAAIYQAGRCVDYGLLFFFFFLCFVCFCSNKKKLVGICQNKLGRTRASERQRESL